MRAFEYMEIHCKDGLSFKEEILFDVRYIECDRATMATTLAQWGREGWQMVSKHVEGQSIIFLFVRETSVMQPKAESLEI